MKKTWTLTYECIPGNGVQKETFKSFDDVKQTVRCLISRIGVQHYTDEMRDGINIPYREAMANFIESYVSRKDFFHDGAPSRKTGRWTVPKWPPSSTPTT